MNIEKINELIKTQNEYIQMLSKNISNHVEYLSLHGFTVSEKDVKTGRELRNKIKELKSECQIKNEI